MNIKGEGHSLTFVQGHIDSTFAMFFSLEMVKQIEAKLHVEPPWDSPGHMTNMAAMPIYGKNLKKIFFSGTKKAMTLTVGM